MTAGGHGGAATEIEAFLRSLPFHDQLHLLVWMCQADPVLAARGTGALIEFHAASREQRERHEKERRKRQRRRQRQRQAAAGRADDGGWASGACRS